MQNLSWNYDHYQFIGAFIDDSPCHGGRRLRREARIKGLHSRKIDSLYRAAKACTYVHMLPAN